MIRKLQRVGNFIKIFDVSHDRCKKNIYRNYNKGEYKIYVFAIHSIEPLDYYLMIDSVTDSPKQYKKIHK